MKMNLEKAIEQLKELRNDCREFDSIETKVEDVEALNLAINELERTAQEVPVQEQLNVKEKIYKIIDLIEGLSLYEWDKLKNCIDREFKSQANKTKFKNGDRFKEILNLDIIQEQSLEIRLDGKIISTVQKIHD